MKKQVQKGKEDLINNLQLKIKQLQSHRKSLNKTNLVNHTEQKVFGHINSYHENIQNINKTPTLYEKEQLNNKLENLRIQYEQKKNFQQLGIKQSDPKKLSRLLANKNALKKLQMEQQLKKEKMLIIAEQTKKAEQFLRQSKTSQIERHALQKMHYQSLLADQQNILERYGILINKSKQSLTQKQQILEMTFRFLQKFNKVLEKKYLSHFLLANTEFCRIFKIGRQEILRDLSVYESKLNGVLDYDEFYQFVKSIQITSKALKPNISKKIQKKPNAKGQNSKIIQGTKQKQSKQIQKANLEMRCYLKKIFQYLDQHSEHLIQRQKIEIACKKCLLWDSKYKLLTKDTVINFGKLIQSKRLKVIEQNYFKGLDTKFIGILELLQLYDSFCQNQKSKQFNSESENQIYGQTYNLQNQKEQQINQNENLQKQIHLDQFNKDFQQQKCGWSHDNAEQKFSTLAQFDNFSKGLSQKYGNEIHWNGIDQYHQDFTNFNKCVSELNSKHLAETQIVEKRQKKIQ